MPRYPYSSADSIDQKIRDARARNESTDVCKIDAAQDLYYNIALGLIDRPVQRILDTGCYQGAFSARLLKETSATQVTGIDPSTESIAIARARFPDVTFVEDDAETADLNGPYDFIYAMGWLHVKSAEAIDRTLRNLVSALAPDGRIIITGGYKNWAGVPFETFREIVEQHLSLMVELNYEKHREYAPEGRIRFSARHYFWMLERP